MRVRLFGGWDFSAGDLDRPDWVEIGYARGVPMGGDLPPVNESSAPSFPISAWKDPDGANIDRMQIVKGWTTAGGETAEHVYDVALSAGRTISATTGRAPPVGSSMDVADASYSNDIGSGRLATVWIDPDFDPDQPAFYYARVIEIPTPRWTAYDAQFFDIKMPDEVPMTTQERAYTSPIWYTPPQ